MKRDLVTFYVRFDFINSTDTDEEIAKVIELSKANGAFDAVECTHYAEGGFNISNFLSFVFFELILFQQIIFYFVHFEQISVLVFLITPLRVICLGNFASLWLVTCHSC